MEISMLNLKTQSPNYFPPMFSPTPTTKQPLVHHWVPPKPQEKQGSSAIIKCGKNTNYVVELKLKKELEEIEKEGKEWREMKNCKGETNTTMVELLECLEKEAIMGDDEGREPIDYNRRAQIFDKSSKVFQALKQIHNDNNSVITKTEQ